MTNQELKTYILGTLLNRTDIDDKIQTAIDTVHLNIQRDIILDEHGVELQPDWNCMVTTAYATHAAGDASVPFANIKTSLIGGTTVPVKRITEVRQLDSSSNDLGPIHPATQQEVQGYKQLQQDIRGGTRQNVRYIGSTSSQYGRGFVQRWFQDGLELKLFYPPSSTAEAIALKLRVLQILPAYTLPGSTDWFSENVWDVMAYGASAVGCAYLWQENERAPMFQGMYDKKLITAYKADIKNRLGGHARVFRPPLPIGRRI